MNKTAVATKLADLQAQIVLIKQAMVDSPDFDVDEKNWAQVRPTAQRVRKALYRERYGKK